MRARTALTTATCALFVVACVKTPDAAPDGTGGASIEAQKSDASGVKDVASPDAAVDAFEWPFCEPGTPKNCVGEPPTTTVMACNETGEAFEEQTCVDADGQPVWCLNGACGDCIPGIRRCLDDDIVQECNEQGLFVDIKTCSQEETGQICQQGACVKLCEVNRKYNSYIGCEYWAVDLDNAFVPGGSQGYFDAAGAQFAIVASNPNVKQSAEIKIYQKNGGEEEEVLLDSHSQPLDLSPLPPSTLRVFNVPRRDVEGTVLAPLAYRVESSIPVTVHQFNPLDNEVEVFSNDASLLLPVDGLGKYYIVMAREQTFAQLRAYITVVAVSDDTQVSVTVTAPTLAMNEFDHMEPGDTITVNMNRYDVLNIETDAPGADLTGTVVLATRNVAVFGGSEASNAPNTAACSDSGVCEWDGTTPCDSLLDCLDFNTCCADHLEQQMFPVKTWGTTYVATKTIERGKEKDIWRILAAQDATKVTTYPQQALIPVLNKGDWFEFESAENFEIVAKKPILVGQYLAAEDAPDPNINGANELDDAGIGDPAFLLAVPIEQYRKEYVVLTPNAYELDYINVTLPIGATVEVDGKTLDPVLFDPISSTFQVVRVLVSDGEHLVVSDKKIGVIAYGFDKYVSYAYPGGLDLKDLGLVNETGE